MDNKRGKSGNKLGRAMLEIFGGVLALLICFAVGFGILYFLGGHDLLRHMDFEVAIVLGMLIVCILGGAIFTVVYLVKKLKK